MQNVGLIKNVMYAYKENLLKQEAEIQLTRQKHHLNTDLAGPVDNESIYGFKYMQSFTDVCTGVVFVYFLKAKSDVVQATEKFFG